LGTNSSLGLGRKSQKGDQQEKKSTRERQKEVQKKKRTDQSMDCVSFEGGFYFGGGSTGETPGEKKTNMKRNPNAPMPINKGSPHWPTKTEKKHQQGGNVN